MSPPALKRRRLWQRLARFLKLYERDPAPRWFRLLMLVIAVLLLVLTPLVVMLGGSFRLSHAGSLCMAVSFLLILGADGLAASRAEPAARMRLVGIMLLLLGAVAYLVGWIL